MHFLCVVRQLSVECCCLRAGFDQFFHYSIISNTFQHFLLVSRLMLDSIDGYALASDGPYRCADSPRQVGAALSHQRCTRWRIAARRKHRSHLPFPASGQPHIASSSWRSPMFFERFLLLANNTGLLSGQDDPVMHPLMSLPTKSSHMALVRISLNLMRHEQQRTEVHRPSHLEWPLPNGLMHESGAGVKANERALKTKLMRRNDTRIFIHREL
jgi:hypothetical protein